MEAASASEDVIRAPGVCILPSGEPERKTPPCRPGAFCLSFAPFFQTMSTPKTTEPKAASSAAPERGETMSGAEILVECLIREGVDTIFAYPGGASMHMHQALTQREDKIRTLSAAPRAGRRFRGGRLCARDRQGGRVHGDQRPGRDESGDRHRRRLSRLDAARGDHRPGAAGA